MAHQQTELGGEPLGQILLLAKLAAYMQSDGGEQNGGEQGVREKCTRHKLN